MTNNRVQEFSSSGSYLGQISSITGKFNFSGGGSQGDSIAFDSSGNIWVTDSGHNRVEEFNSSGTWLATLGGGTSSCTSCLCTGAGPSSCPANSGTGNGQFSDPNGVAIGSR